MDVACCDGGYAMNGNDEPSVFLDAFDMAFSTFEGPVDNSHMVADVVFGTVVSQKEQSVCASSDDEDEHFHFAVRYGCWTLGTFVPVAPKVPIL